MRNTVTSANGAVDLVATAHSEEGEVVFVISAKAEIQRARDEYLANALDSRFRGNDGAVQ